MEMNGGWLGERGGELAKPAGTLAAHRFYLPYAPPVAVSFQDHGDECAKVWIKYTAQKR